MKFFFDNNLSPKLAHSLNIILEPDHQVIHLKDKFPPDTEDVVWMQALAKEKDWIIVTADVRIGRNPHEVRAWKEAGHTIFFLKPGWTDLQFREQFSKFAKCVWQIIEQAIKANQGDAFAVTVNGKIEKIG